MFSEICDIARSEKYSVLIIIFATIIFEVGLHLLYLYCTMLIPIRYQQSENINRTYFS